jgi:hypothetical protein
VQGLAWIICFTSRARRKPIITAGRSKQGLTRWSSKHTYEAKHAAGVFYGAAVWRNSGWRKE